MDAQDASGLCFGPSTCPRKANEKIYKLTKDGAKGHTPGMAALPSLPNWPSFGPPTETASLTSVLRCVGAFNAQNGGIEVILRE
jgi:hypothetical protein